MLRPSKHLSNIDSKNIQKENLIILLLILKYPSLMISYRITMKYQWLQNRFKIDKWPSSVHQDSDQFSIYIIMKTIVYVSENISHKNLIIRLFTQHPQPTHFLSQPTTTADVDVAAVMCHINNCISLICKGNLLISQDENYGLQILICCTFYIWYTSQMTLQVCTLTRIHPHVYPYPLWNTLDGPRIISSYC